MANPPVGMFFNRAFEVVANQVLCSQKPALHRPKDVHGDVEQRKQYTADEQNLSCHPPPSTMSDFGFLPRAVNSARRLAERIASRLHVDRG